MNLQLLNQVTAFIWAEGDMLDHGDFDTWLSLWSEKGTYIIPIDPKVRVTRELYLQKQISS